MNNLKKIVRRRMMLFFSNIIICLLFIVNYLNSVLFPIICDYGEYQGNNLITRIVNVAISEHLTDTLKDKAVIQTNEEISIIEFNVELLNSLTCNIINRIQQILYKLEYGELDDSLLQILGISTSQLNKKRGMFYEIPLSVVTNNSLITNLGPKIPVKYKLVGEMQGQIISTIEEYGINNVLLKIDLEIRGNSKILIPMTGKEKSVVMSVPLIIKVIQGEIPDYYLGTKVIGGVQ